MSAIIASHCSIVVWRAMIVASHANFPGALTLALMMGHPAVQDGYLSESCLTPQAGAGGFCHLGRSPHWTERRGATSRTSVQMNTERASQSYSQVPFGMYSPWIQRPWLRYDDRRPWKTRLDAA